MLGLVVLAIDPCYVSSVSYALSAYIIILICINIDIWVLQFYFIIKLFLVIKILLL